MKNNNKSNLFKSVITTLFATSIAFTTVSCDDDDKSESSEMISEINSLSSLEAVDVVENGKVTADIGDGTYEFTITSSTANENIATGLCDVIVRFNGVDPVTVTGAEFTFDSDLDTFEASRKDLEPAVIQTRLRSLAANELSSEFNAAVTSPSESTIDAFIVAVTREDSNFLLDYIDVENNDNPVFVVNSVKLTATSVENAGLQITQEDTARSITVTNSVISYIDTVSSGDINYAAP